jgi:hypothetical protein
MQHNLSLSDDTKNVLMVEINKLDDIITSALLQMEKLHCARKAAALWTPILRQSSLSIQYWNVAAKMKRQRIPNSYRLDLIRAQMDDESIQLIEDNLKSPRAAFRHAVKEDKQLKKEHRKLRAEYLENKLEELNMNKKATGKQLTSMKSLVARERTRYGFAYIRSITKPTKGKVLKSIEVPHATIPGRYDSIREPVEMEIGLIDRNVGHFAQADNTPFANEPLLESLGYEGINENSENLINQKLMDERINNQPEYIKDILDKLNDGNTLPEIEADITFEEFKQGLIKWKESTTTSPSGRHLGHYKLLTSLPVMDKFEENCNISETILQAYYNIAICTAKMCKTLNRWTKISTCMIEK